METHKPGLESRSVQAVPGVTDTWWLTASVSWASSGWFLIDAASLKGRLCSTLKGIKGQGGVCILKNHLWIFFLKLC